MASKMNFGGTGSSDKKKVVDISWKGKKDEKKMESAVQRSHENFEEDFGRDSVAICIRNHADEMTGDGLGRRGLAC